MVKGVLAFLVCVVAFGQQFDDRIRQGDGSHPSAFGGEPARICEASELSNREVWTGKYIAQQLRQIGFEDVRTGVARTGVVALLKGGKPGRVVAWRADMDGLSCAGHRG